MKKISSVKYCSVALLIISSAAYSQQNSQSKPLADVAREQQAVRAQKKPAPVYTIDSQNTADGSQKSTVRSEKTTEDVGAKQPAAKGSVLDRPLNEKRDPFVVPAGTEIRVDLTEKKVTVPVRVGFATPIPALSKVAVDTDRTYFQTSYDGYNAGNPGYVEYVTLTTVTVQGKTYSVKTDRIQLNGTNVHATVGAGPTSIHDAVFTLSEPLSMER